MSTRDHGSSQSLVLEVGRSDRQYGVDVWRYCELFFILAWRDVAVRHKRTLIGVVWGFARPFMTSVVFTVVYGSLARPPTGGAAPYAILVFAGLLPWTLFSAVLGDASSTEAGNTNLINFCHDRGDGALRLAGPIDFTELSPAPVESKPGLG